MYKFIMIHVWFVVKIFNSSLYLVPTQTKFNYIYLEFYLANSLAKFQENYVMLVFNKRVSQGSWWNQLIRQLQFFSIQLTKLRIFVLNSDQNQVQDF